MGRPKKRDETGIKERLILEMVNIYGRNGAGTRLSKAVGVSTGQASRWESGKNIPSLGMIVKISRALGLDPGWLAFGDLSRAPREGMTRGKEGFTQAEVRKRLAAQRRRGPGGDEAENEAG